MTKILAFLRREPVAVWGALLAVIMAALPELGVSSTVVEALGTIGSLLGIPVVRWRVTPTAKQK